MSASTYERLPKQFQMELADHLKKYAWTHAISLAFNSGEVKPRVADERLGQLMARLNRMAVGPRWKHKPDEQIFALWFLEKPLVNTHWHGVLWLEQTHVQKLVAVKDLNSVIQYKWSKLVPSGTIDVKLIWDQPGWIEYIAKEIRNPVSYNNFRVFTGIQ